MVIAVEGMDGSGKTTISKRLAGKWGMEFTEMPNKKFLNMQTPEYDELCKKIYKSGDDIAALFFGFGNILQATQGLDKDVIFDRHFLSNYFWNGTEKNENIFSLLVSIAGKPDLTIVLYAGPQERMGRIRKRNASDKDLSDPDKLIFGYDKMIEFAKRYDLPFLVINTERYDEEMTFKICDKLLEKIRNMDRAEVLEYCHVCNARLKNMDRQPFAKYL